MRISRRLMKLIVGKDDNPVIVLASGKSIPNPSLDQCSPMIPDFSLFKVPKIDWKGRSFKISFEFWIWNYKCANNCSTFGSKFKNSLLWWPTHQLRNWSFYQIRTGSSLTSLIISTYRGHHISTGKVFHSIGAPHHSVTLGHWLKHIRVWHLVFGCRTLECDTFLCQFQY